MTTPIYYEPRPRLQTCPNYNTNYNELFTELRDNTSILLTFNRKRFVDYQSYAWCETGCVVIFLVIIYRTHMPQIIQIIELVLLLS